MVRAQAASLSRPACRALVAAIGLASAQCVIGAEVKYAGNWQCEAAPKISVPGFTVPASAVVDGDRVTTLRMSGPAAVLLPEKENFLQLARSLRPAGTETAAAADPAVSRTGAEIAVLLKGAAGEAEKSRGFRRAQETGRQVGGRIGQVTAPAGGGGRRRNCQSGGGRVGYEDVRPHGCDHPQMRAAA